MITLAEFQRIEAEVRDAGYGETIGWSETLSPPTSARQFASKAIFVICSSGMRYDTAVQIHDRCMQALRRGKSATTVFGHPGKSAAIDRIWATRKRLFKECRTAPDLLAFCATLPWIGPVTKYHLAKNLGGDFAKPDVHLQRLADAEGTTPQELCERLAHYSGYRVATVDTILWRACESGIIRVG